MHKPKFFVLFGMILLAAASRLIPHLPNFTPVAAMALFSGAHFSDKRLAFLVPLTAMFLSDLLIGMHPLIPVIYGSFALIVLIGFWLREHPKVLWVASAAMAGSVLFFLVTNFGVWAFTDFYHKSFAGLLACYIAAIPFFQNTLFGDALYTTLLFGSFALAEKRFPVLGQSSLKTIS